MPPPTPTNPWCTGDAGQRGVDSFRLDRPSQRPIGRSNEAVATTIGSAEPALDRPKSLRCRQRQCRQGQYNPRSKKKKNGLFRSYIPEHDNIRFNSVWAGESPQLGSEEAFSLYSAATSISLNLFHIVTSMVRFSIISVDVRK